MAGLTVILLYACKLAFLASSTRVTIEFSFKNEARKAFSKLHERIVIMPAFCERGLLMVFIVTPSKAKIKTSE